MLIFKLNERKSEKAAGASPQAPLGELAALLLAVTGGERPLQYPPPLVNIVIRPPFPEILDPPLVLFDFFLSKKKFYFLKMTENEWKFLQDQRSERKM